jgi:predicted MPP superfamily phosphohydrolase
VSFALRALGGSVAGLAAYSLLEPHLLAVRHFEVELPGLPASANGLRIAQISDLHVSAMTTPRFLRRLVACCNDMEPDVVAVTGDFVSRRNSYMPLTGARLWARPVMHYAEAAARELSLLRAPEGAFAVPGNHDHFRGRFDAIEELLEKVGVRSLLNRNTRVRGVAFCGLDDLRAGRPNLLASFEGVEASETQVILSHNPRLLPLLRDRNSLVLSGHTHAGQVNVPLINLRLRSADMRGSTLSQGWYRQCRAQMYISSGVGSVHFPARFRCRPEIVVYTLRRRTRA